jgi:hypothetical protein
MPGLRALEIAVFVGFVDVLLSQAITPLRQSSTSAGLIWSLPVSHTTAESNTPERWLEGTLEEAIVVVDDAPAQAGSRKLSKSVRLGLRILSKLIAKHGVENQPLGPNSPTVLTIEKEVHLRPAFHEQRGDLDTIRLRNQALTRFLYDGKAAGVLNSKALADDRVLIWRTT